MGEKRKHMEDELSRFEAEISGATSGSGPNSGSNSLFIPHQLRPVVCANTYSQVQQKLQQNPLPKPGPGPGQGPMMNNMPPPPPHIAPAFVSTFLPHSDHSVPEKSYSSEPTPVVLSSAPKLYTNRMSINPTETPIAPQIDISNIQFDVTQKLKKLKTEKPNGPNPIAEAAIQAAKASSALQNFQINEKRKKDKKTVRVAGGQVWEDPSLADWESDDFRIFCGDLGNDVNDELLTRTFNKFPSFTRAKVIRDKRTGKSKGFGFVSFKEPGDFIRAMKEMDGRYVGSRPIKLRKSTWRARSFEVVKRKEKEKAQLLQMFNK
ncbi:RNA-binding protein 42 [Sitodiplosis mosellana]|uniref:RNA-binding protein 42 n=1 Tax=Sitodiplosis mosellana TaxID=263140 RepID=UPI0024442E95|nr:RNA-binding protein 42 [Sitodiplosis mosellana]